MSSEFEEFGNFVALKFFRIHSLPYYWNWNYVSGSVLNVEGSCIFMYLYLYILSVQILCLGICDYIICPSTNYKNTQATSKSLRFLPVSFQIHDYNQSLCCTHCAVALGQSPSLASVFFHMKTWCGWCCRKLSLERQELRIKVPYQLQKMTGPIHT